MKKKQRKILHPSVLAAEKAAITQFMFDVSEPEKGAKIPLSHVYKHYHVWRRSLKLSKSALTLDGFGRLFPKSYERRGTYWAGAKHSLKCVFGLKLK